jgi:hypothetical protein
MKKLAHFEMVEFYNKTSKKLYTFNKKTFYYLPIVYRQHGKS